MNQRHAKTQRRDLRRAIGAGALTVVEQHGHMIESALMPSIHSLKTIAEDSDKRLDACEAQIGLLGEQLVLANRKIRDLEYTRNKQRTLWQRIVWIVCGE